MGFFRLRKKEKILPNVSRKNWPTCVLLNGGSASAERLASSSEARRCRCKQERRKRPPYEECGKSAGASSGAERFRESFFSGTAAVGRSARLSPCGAALESCGAREASRPRPQRADALAASLPGACGSRPLPRAPAPAITKTASARPAGSLRPWRQAGASTARYNAQQEATLADAPR